MFLMIDHLPCHSSVNANIFSRNESRFAGTQKQDHFRDILRSADSPDRLLKCVGTGDIGIRGIDPSRRNAVDPHLSRKTDSQGVCEGGDASFSGSIAFRLRLAHAVAG